MAALETTQTPPKKRRRLFWGLAVIAALAFGWHVVSIIRSPRLPFSDKDRVLASIPWRVPESKRAEWDNGPYTWLDNETVVYAAPDSRHKYHLRRQRVRGGSVSAPEPARNTRPLDYADQISISPDGKWLLALDMGGTSTWGYSVYGLDGNGRKQHYDMEAADFTWLADSQSFVTGVDPQGRAMQYQVNKHAHKLLTFPQQLSGSPQFSSQGEYFVGEESSSGTAPLKLERGSLLGGKSQVHTVRSLAATETTYLTAVSPSGDRLLWFRSTYNTPWLAALWGNVTRRRAEENYYHTWYVTDTQGNEVKTLPTILLNSPQTSGITREYYLPQWLPDGKHLSIVYKDALYVVEVP